MTRCLLSLMIVFAALSVSAKGKVPAEKDMAGYLFAYFTGNNNNKEEEAIRFALSDNGFDYKALNGNRPVIKSSLISETGGVRDPAYSSWSRQLFLYGCDRYGQCQRVGFQQRNGSVEIVRSSQLDSFRNQYPEEIQRAGESEKSMGSPDHL